jgi:predicted O-methyltransferase YrrM
MQDVKSLPDHAARIGAYLQEARARGTVRGKSGKTIEFGKTPIRAAQDQTLIDAIVQERPERTLETGFAYGFSTLLFCKSMLENGTQAPQHVAIDPFQSGDVFDSAGLIACEEAGVSDMLEFYHEGSQYVLPRLIKDERSFDLIFIDGGHLFELAFMDILFSISLIRPGGLILVDDMWMPSVRAAVDYAVKNLGLIHENAVAAKPLGLLRRARNMQRSPQEQTAFLRRPVELPKRNWDHFVPFDHAW